MMTITQKVCLWKLERYRNHLARILKLPVQNSQFQNFWMMGHSLLGIRFHGRWSRLASGRLIKVKYTGNSLGGIWSGRLQQVVI